MTLTVLFDLDDTLLKSHMGSFLPAYFSGLGQTLAQLGSQEKIKKQIRYAVGEMVANQDPSKYLKEIFASNFYAPLRTTESECQPALDRFYTEEFPKFRSLVSQNPKAKLLIKWCQSQQMKLAITTNPLFPETATRQRIEWAGLDPQDFTFFSTYDNFHFTKPNFRFYAEALGRLGWPEDSLVMVGDDLTLDLLPAEQMGLATFWIDPEIDSANRPHGTLADAQDFLSSLHHKKEVLKLSNDPEVLLAVLRSTPAVINTWLDDYDSGILHQPPAKDEWSVNEVFWHLADFEERVYLPQWEQLLINPNQPVSHVETSHWAEAHDYASREPKKAWERFMRSRNSSLEIINALFEKGLFEIFIHHTVFSETQISELVAFAAKHDRLHLRQCAESLKI